MEPSANCSLQTPRLDLEVIGPGHADLLHAGLSDPRIYTYFDQEPPRSAAELRAVFERWSARRSPEGAQLWLNWAARDRASGRYVGHLQATVLLPQARALLAYIVFPEHWRRGYAREGCLAVLAHLFGAHAIDSVSAEIDSENLASIGLIESLGFRLAATRRDAAFFKGRTSHEHTYELPRAAWAASER